MSDILKKARQSVLLFSFFPCPVDTDPFLVAYRAGPPPTREEPSSRTAPSWGSGNTLGSDTAQSVVVPDPNSAMADEDEDDDEDEDEVAVRHLTFWRNGFSLEDGPLREYDAPGSREILEAINNGFVSFLAYGDRDLVYVPEFIAWWLMGVDRLRCRC